MPGRLVLTLSVMLTLAALDPWARAAEDDRKQAMFDRAAPLAAGLDADSAPERAAAERGLVELAGSGRDAERLLSVWPRLEEGAPAAVRAGLDRARSVVEQRMALAVLGPSRVKLDARAMPIAEALESIAEQTGNDVSLGDGAEGVATRVTIDLADKPFWEGLDALLDSAMCALEPYAGNGLRVTPRPDGWAPRTGKATYAGPLRIEPLRLKTSAGVRAADERALDVVIEVAWEPRLRPIAIAHAMSDLRATASRDTPVAPRQPKQQIDIEAPADETSVEVTLPLVLPERSLKRVERIEGTFEVLAPTRRSVFRFDRAGGSTKKRSETRSGAAVTLEGFALRGELWELRMKLELASAGDALASHRGWVFDNPSHLEGPKGVRFEHSGFETVLQTESAVGLVYYFEFGDPEDQPKGFDPRDLTWVYETPVGVVQTRLRYTLGPLDLP
ncbi:MAG: hypothetical protein ACRCT8_01245 [Lacipirellulaceae bacterium]